MLFHNTFNLLCARNSTNLEIVPYYASFSSDNSSRQVQYILWVVERRRQNEENQFSCEAQATWSRFAWRILRSLHASFES